MLAAEDQAQNPKMNSLEEEEVNNMGKNQLWEVNVEDGMMPTCPGLQRSPEHQHRARGREGSGD